VKCRRVRRAIKRGIDMFRKNESLVLATQQLQETVTINFDSTLNFLPPLMLAAAALR